MKKRTTILASVLALGLVLAACSTQADGSHVASAANPPQAETSNAAADDLRRAMRKLWEDHITWTRMFIVSAAAGLPDTNVAAERLLRNQDDIGDAIKPFYGEAAGDKLTALLRQHILVAADIVTAAKAGDDARVERTRTAWYANGDQIATYLTEANPDNWPREAVLHHMRTHLDLTLEEAVARLQGKWAEDVAAYDKIHDAILEMADALSGGIIAQFPERFS